MGDFGSILKSFADSQKIPFDFVIIRANQFTSGFAKEAFAKYLNEVNLDDRQIYFVNQIVEYIVHNGIMKDLSVLQEAPFTDKGSVVEIFTDMSVWMGIRKVIERINMNAAA